MGVWWSRNCYCPCCKRKDGTAMGVVKVRITESMLPVDKRLYTDPYADNFLIGAGIMRRMGVEKILMDGIILFQVYFRY